MTVSVTAARLHENGGPELFRLEQVELAEPGPGEVRVRATAIGLNFADVYQRTGLYAVPLPAVLGFEAAGVVEAVGEDAGDIRPGERVATVDGSGCYAEAFLAPAERLIRLPPSLDDRTAVAALGKAMTVEFLLERCFKVRRGQTIVFHAAAGGVGLIACQWARALGAHVIGTVSTRAKAELAAANGCQHPVVTSEEDLVTRVREITKGKGVPVVYDSVGRDSFQASLDCLARRGTLVSFGQSSGEPDPFRPRLLAEHGSIYITRPVMGDYTVNGNELQASANRVLAMLDSGKVKITIGQSFRLAEITEAHRTLEGRRTVGSTVIVP